MRIENDKPMFPHVIPFAVMPPTDPNRIEVRIGGKLVDEAFWRVTQGGHLEIDRHAFDKLGGGEISVEYGYKGRER